MKPIMGLGKHLNASKFTSIRASLYVYHLYIKYMCVCVLVIVTF